MGAWWTASILVLVNRRICGLEASSGAELPGVGAKRGVGVKRELELGEEMAVGMAAMGDMGIKG